MDHEEIKLESCRVKLSRRGKLFPDRQRNSAEKVRLARPHFVDSRENSMLRNIIDLRKTVPFAILAISDPKDPNADAVPLRAIITCYPDHDLKALNLSPKPSSSTSVGPVLTGAALTAFAPSIS